MSYFRNMPRVYIVNLQTGEQKVVGDFRGMTFAPRFSPMEKTDNKSSKRWKFRNLG